MAAGSRRHPGASPPQAVLEGARDRPTRVTGWTVGSCQRLVRMTSFWVARVIVT